VFFKFPGTLTAATGRFDATLRFDVELPTGTESTYSPAVLVGPFGKGEAR
jgi:hypothetical protein